MTDTETGATVTPADVTIALNDSFVEALSADQLDAYVAIVSGLHEEAARTGVHVPGAPEDAVHAAQGDLAMLTGDSQSAARVLADQSLALEKKLREGLDAAGILVSEHDIGLLASRIRAASAGELSIITNSGRVLTGRADAAAPPDHPTSAEDPQDPNRPLYS